VPSAVTTAGFQLRLDKAKLEELIEECGYVRHHPLALSTLDLGEDRVGQSTGITLLAERIPDEGAHGVEGKELGPVRMDQYRLGANHLIEDAVNTAEPQHARSIAADRGAVTGELSGRGTPSGQ